MPILLENVKHISHLKPVLLYRCKAKQNPRVVRSRDKHAGGKDQFVAVWRSFSICSRPIASTLLTRADVRSLSQTSASALIW